MPDKRTQKAPIMNIASAGQVKESHSRLQGYHNRFQGRVLMTSDSNSMVVGKIKCGVIHQLMGQRSGVRIAWKLLSPFSSTVLVCIHKEIRDTGRHHLEKVKCSCLPGDIFVNRSGIAKR